MSCVNGQQGQELLVLQEPIAYLLGLATLDSFPQFACCFAHEDSPPFTVLSIIESLLIAPSRLRFPHSTFFFIAIGKGGKQANYAEGMPVE